MEEVPSYLKLFGFLMVVLGATISLFYMQTARIAAQSAASSAVTSASNILGGSDSAGNPWDCSDTHPLWPIAEEGAVLAAVARTSTLLGVYPTEVKMEVTPLCVLIVSVTAVAPGVVSLLSSQAVSCATPLGDPLALPGGSSDPICPTIEL